MKGSLIFCHVAWLDRGLLTVRKTFSKKWKLIHFFTALSICVVVRSIFWTMWLSEEAELQIGLWARNFANRKLLLLQRIMPWKISVFLEMTFLLRNWSLHGIPFHPKCYSYQKRGEARSTCTLILGIWYDFFILINVLWYFVRATSMCLLFISKAIRKTKVYMCFGNCLW